MNNNPNCGCTETQTTTYTCNECQSNTPCDCAVRDLSTDCILFTSDTIQCQNTNVIVKNTTLSVALKNIVDFFCQKMAELQDYLKIKNIGAGAKIYKGDNLLGQKELRTITSEDSSVTIVEGTSTIDLKVTTANATASNVGTGAGVFKELSSNDYKFRKIKTENSGTGAAILKPQVENTNDISIAAKTLKAENVGATGASIVKDVVQNTDDITIRNRKLKSSDGTVVITQNADDIDFTIPEPPSFGYLKSFYVNSAYLPTVDSPSDGSIIRPYVSYDEAKAAFIGTGTITTPEFNGAIIILQTDSTTAVNPTVNNLKLKFENNSSLNYTGTDLYMFDTEILYPLIPKTAPRNNLTISVYMELLGEGTITRTTGIGLVRGMGSNRTGVAIAGDLDSQIVLNGNITLQERLSYPPEVWDGNITNQAGTTLESIYGQPHKYSLTLLPTTPLLYSEYGGFIFGFGVQTSGTITFRTLVNTAIKTKGTVIGGENFNFLIGGNYIATSSATKMVGFPSHYPPQPNRNMVELDNADLVLYGELKVEDKGGYQTTGVENFFKNINNSGFQGNINIFSNYYMGKFLNLSDVSNTDTLFNLTLDQNGSKIQTPGNYFIDTPLTPFTLKMVNSTVSGFTNKSTSPITLTVDTQGTLSSFLNTPVISNITSYANDGAATAAGLVANSLYFNTTNNALDLV